MPPYERDPVSRLFDGGARSHLQRAYRRPERWTGQLLAVPGQRLANQLAQRGIQWAGPDVSTARGGGGLNARTRWARGYIRALYYQHKWFSGGGQRGWRASKRTEPRHAGAIEVRVGRAQGVTAAGRPAGRMVYICFHPRGGEAARQAKNAKSERGRYIDPDGEQGNLTSDVGLRDW